MLGMFFLPLGYDVAFYMLNNKINSYLLSTLFFYIVSASFFGIYIYLSEITPKTFIKEAIQTFSTKIRKILTK